MSDFLRQSSSLCRQLMELWQGKRVPNVVVDAQKQAIVFVYSGENWQAYKNAIEQVSQQAPGLEQSN